MFLKASKTDRQKRESKGRLAESWAAFFLRLKGYQILKQRYKNPLGEIDLVLKRGGTLVFCEVKARTSYKTGLEALAPYQQKRISDGARYFLSRHPQFSTYDYRFDYIVVVGLRCHHLQNAWQL